MLDAQAGKRGARSYRCRCATGDRNPKREPGAACAIQWGDFLFRQDTRESVNAALQLYVTAERLLGPRPRVVKAPGGFSSRTFRELERVIMGERPDQEGVDPFGNSLVELENLLPPKPPTQQNPPCIPPLPVGALTTVPYFCIPRNEKLMGYWHTVADRLYKIRHCQNIEGIERRLALFAPPIDPGLLVRAVAAGLSIGDVVAQGAGEIPHYRFQTLAQKATELVQMVAGFGNALSQTIEKKYAEALAQLRSNHEIRVLKLVREIKLQAIHEARSGRRDCQRQSQRCSRGHPASWAFVAVTSPQVPGKAQGQA